MKLLQSQLDSPLGTMLLVTDETGKIHALDFADRKTRQHQYLNTHYSQIQRFDTEAPTEIVDHLSRYFNGELEALNSLQVITEGSELQHQVWEQLRQIPAGTTTSYGKLAKKLGFSDPRAAIDIGAANGTNPIAMIIPCHRVIASNGDLKGYAWGLHRKRWLLEHEKKMVSGGIIQTGSQIKISLEL